MDPSINAANLATPSVSLSPWALFVHAALVVKLVMIGLVCASIWVWAVIFDKYFTLRKVKRQADEFEDLFWSGGSLDELYENIGVKPTHPMAAVFSAGMGEWRRSARINGIEMSSEGVKQRIDRAMSITITREMERLERWVTFLATVGPVAPFIGLFGTVWGIMHAFASIAQSNNTSLAVVAPGISEALFATALGLLTAIPAVVAYNFVNNKLNLFAERLEGFAAEFSAILSRQSEAKENQE
ncbi:protein TolQ [Commensalibacter melissae]|uniref:protein TolQ n=1 Tax=Commensalibacter melissae TaxID=2070537 RepID=UPI0012D86FE9|nr:protein TolQ [Commensalibacter melissae]MUG77513.1 protein TolQ [Commensalibacter melissae]MUH04292.1 protein TolQ [Commensalibacter melissae]